MSEKNKGLDLSVVLALVAVIISLCTMAISIVETNIMQKQQNAMTESAKASVWPYAITLIETKMNNGEIQFEVQVINKGVGPAIIKNIDVTYEGELIGSSLLELVRKNCPLAVAKSIKSNTTNNSVISPGESRSILSMDLTEADFMKFAKFASKLDVQYCYANIYGDLWMSTDKTPISTQTCW